MRKNNVLEFQGREIRLDPLTELLRTDLVLDTLEQALWSRTRTQGLIHHSDQGCQYLSIRYTERLAEAGVELSVGSVGDSYEREACPWGVMRWLRPLTVCTKRR